jgi:hypothetical protein
VAETRVKGLDLESLIALVKQAADAQETQGVSGVSSIGQTPGATPRTDSLGFTGGLFPKDSVPSSVRPRERRGEGVNAIELQLEQADRERDLALSLFDSTKALDKSTAEAEAAQERLQAVREVLERQVQRSMGRRSIRRGEWREARNQFMDNDRDYWFMRNREMDLNNIDLRRLQYQLESLR